MGSWSAYGTADKVLEELSCCTGPLCMAGAWKKRCTEFCAMQSAIPHACGWAATSPSGLQALAWSNRCQSCTSP